MASLPVEIFVVGILTMIIGLIVSHIMMGKDARNFKHWHQVAASYFITGVLIHMICEATGINKWYCTNGHACQPDRESNAR